MFFTNFLLLFLLFTNSLLPFPFLFLLPGRVWILFYLYSTSCSLSWSPLPEFIIPPPPSPHFWEGALPPTSLSPAFPLPWGNPVSTGLSASSATEARQASPLLPMCQGARTNPCVVLDWWLTFWELWGFWVNWHCFSSYRGCNPPLVPYILWLEGNSVGKDLHCKCEGLSMDAQEAWKTATIPSNLYTLTMARCETEKAQHLRVPALWPPLSH